MTRTLHDIGGAVVDLSGARKTLRHRNQTHAYRPLRTLDALSERR